MVQPVIKTSALCATPVAGLVTPAQIAQRYPVADAVTQQISATRQRIEDILHGRDKRLLVVIGPCSVHDPGAALEYARRLQARRGYYQQRLEIVMRTYFEKPRTVTGWKGLISDPDLDGSCQMNKGIALARQLLVEINSSGLPTATEFLDRVIGQFFSGLISWGAIGARTTESQIHREMASALSCPIGFKNGTDGNVRIATDAVRAAQCSHMFLSADDNGQMTIYQTRGNPYGHIILRGGRKPNYYADDIAAACNELITFGLAPYLVVDFSHGNCQKRHSQQLLVCEDVCRQIKTGTTAIAGVMVESFLQGGNQPLVAGGSLNYGQSVTDPCLSWQDSEVLLDMLASAVDSRF